MPKNKPKQDELRLEREFPGCWSAYFDGWEESGQWYGSTKEEAEEKALEWLSEQDD